MAKAQRGKRCYLYTRVSTEMQIEGYSLDAQKELLLSEAKHQRMTVVQIFSDEGKSGKNTTGRPAFREMMHRIETHADDVDYVLVYKLSRFGRNTADVLSNVQLMEDFGVHLYSVEDRIDSADEKGKLMISILASVSEMERENIRTQTMSGRIQKAKEGRWNGGQSPYGYYIKDGVLAVEKDEAVIIRLIFDKYVTGDMSMNEVAKWLNDNGYRKKTRQNNIYERISTDFVKRILDNPVYAGYIAYGRRKNEKIDGKRNEFHIVKQKTFGLYEGAHEALIDRDLWEKARYKREQTGKGFQKRFSEEHAHVLSGILKCPLCGASMYGVVCRKKKKGGNGEYYKDIWYYRCKRRIKIDGVNCDYNTHIRQDVLNAEVRGLVQYAFKDIDFTDTIKQAVGILNEDGHLDEELERLESEKLKEQMRKNKLVQKISTLDPDDELYDSMYAELENVMRKHMKHISELDTQIRKVQIAVENSRGGKVTVEQLEKYLKDTIANIDNLSMEQERGLMHALLQSVEIFPEKQENGTQVSRLTFKIPIRVNGATFTDLTSKYAHFDDYDEEENFLPQKSHDETIALLSKDQG